MANKPKLNILRLLLCAFVLCVLMAGIYICYVKSTPIVTQKLEELNPQKQGDMNNTLWLIEKIFFICPVFVLLLCQTLFYRTQKSAPGIKHREQAWEITAVFLFTYAVLLPAVVMYSKRTPPVIDPVTGDQELSLILKTAQWFMWQFIFFLVPILYHRVRADENKNDKLPEKTEAEKEET